MKRCLKMLFRLCLEVMLTVIFMPLILLISLMSLIYYMIIVETDYNNKKILDGVIIWLKLIEKGIDMNIDFIVNGL